MRSAAGQIWPHLQSGERPEVEQRRKPNSLSEAMYPRPQSRPQRPKGLDEENPWYDIMMAAAGLRRMR
jgi:hypothetical protein